MTRAQSTPRLNRLAVIEAAETLIDEGGWTALTMTALAATLDVRVPSLYSHVDSLEDLLSEVQIRAHATLATRFQAAAAARSRANGLRRTAAALRDFAIEHPGLYDLAMSQPRDIQAVLNAAGPSSETLAALAESFGVVKQSWELIMNVVGTLHGVIVLDRVGLFAGVADTDAAYNRAVNMVIDLLEREGDSTTILE